MIRLTSGCYPAPFPSDDPGTTQLPFYWTEAEHRSFGLVFSDKSRRSHPPTSSVTWRGDLYLASWDGNTPGTVTIHDGVRWGWDAGCTATNAQDKALSMTRTLSGVTLHWTTNSPPFLLERSTNLSDSWVVFPTEIMQADGQYRANIESALEWEFFRLRLETNTPPDVQPPYVRASSPPQIVMQSHPLFLFVKTEGTHPITYQWFHEGVQLEGETNRVLIRPQAGFDHAGVYYAVIMNDAGVNFSDEIPVEVVPDDVPPEILSVSASPSLMEVIVRFSERVIPPPAQDPQSYQIFGDPTSPVTVLEAFLSSDGMTLTLVLHPLTPLQPLREYALRVNGVSDLASPPNFIAPGTIVNFVTGAPPPES